MKKKTIIIIAAVVVVGVLAVITLTGGGTKATQVKVEEVVRQNLTEKVSASGRIQPQTKVDITSEVNGEIIALLVVEGQAVNVGDPLVILDTVQIKADVSQAKYALDGARAALDGTAASLAEAEEEYQRQQSLFAKDGTAETAMKAARYAFLNAKAAHERAVAQERGTQAAYDKQLDQLRKANIVAPMEGVITYLDCEVGEIAPAQTSFTQGKVLMTIADLSVFEVEVEVDETEINKIDLEQYAKIEVDAFPDTSFAGKVVEIGNTAIMVGAGTQDQSTNFKVKVQFTDAMVPLRPGMSATVDITAFERNDALAIPFASVIMRNYDMDSLKAVREGATGGDTSPGEVMAAENEDEDTAKAEKDDERKDLKGVFVVREGAAVFMPIETGIAGQKNIEVTSGVEERDTVISGPYSILRTIKDGDKVEVTQGQTGEGDQ
jgi:HlyD family secretion protein